MIFTPIGVFFGVLIVGENSRCFHEESLLFEPCNFAYCSRLKQIPSEGNSSGGICVCGRSVIERDLLHLFIQEFVGEMGIDLSDQPFGAVAHPDVHDIGADVLLAHGGKRVAEIILRDCFVLHDPLENAVEAVGDVQAFDWRGKVEHLSRLRADRDLFVFDFPVLALCVARDEKIAFEMRVGKFAGTKSEKEQNEKSPLIGLKLGEFEPFEQFSDLVGSQSAAVAAFRFLEGDQRHGVMGNDAACHRVFENEIEDDAEALVDAAFGAGHDFVEVDGLDGRNGQVAESREKVTPAIAFVVLVRARIEFSLFEFQPLAGDCGKGSFGSVIFMAVFVNVFRQRFA